MAKDSEGKRPLNHKRDQKNPEPRLNFKVLTEEFGARSHFVEKVYPENKSCTSFNALCWSRKVHGR